MRIAPDHVSEQLAARARAAPPARTRPALHRYVEVALLLGEVLGVRRGVAFPVARHAARIPAPPARRTRPRGDSRAGPRCPPPTLRKRYRQVDDPRPSRRRARVRRRRRTRDHPRTGTCSAGSLGRARRQHRAQAGEQRALGNPRRAAGGSHRRKRARRRARVSLPQCPQPAQSVISQERIRDARAGWTAPSVAPARCSSRACSGLEKRRAGATPPRGGRTRRR